MTAERKIFVETKVDQWRVGDFIPFRWDNKEGEFGGYIELTKLNDDGSFSMRFISPNKEEPSHERQ